MSKSVLHVVPLEGHWAVKREGNERSSSTHDTQKDAIESARNLARDGDDLVIHRPDGTIRDRVTYQDPTVQNGAAIRGPRAKVKPQDIMSVGTRVSWSAIFAGAVVAFAVYAALAALAFAVGISTVEYVRSGTFAVGAFIIGTCIMVGSFFLGGFVTARTTAGETKGEAMIYGVLVWATLFAGLAITQVGIGYGILRAQASTVPPAISQQSTFNSNSNQRDASGQANPKNSSNSVENKTKEAGKKIKNKTEEATEDIQPSTKVWIGFSGLILSMFAAIGGAVVGAGPTLVFQQFRQPQGTADTTVKAKE